MERSAWDKIVSGAGAVVAVVLVLLGSMAIYGGIFARDNVRDRLERYLAWYDRYAKNPKPSAGATSSSSGR